MTSSMIVRHPVAALALAAAVACNGDNAVGLGHWLTGAATVSLNPTPDTLRVDERMRLSPVVQDSGGYSLSSSNLLWTTSDPSVAGVDAFGDVVGVSPGSATITAKSGRASGTAAIVVYKPVAAIVQLLPSVDTLATDHAVELFAVVKDQLGRTLDTSSIDRWTSSDPTVATVDSFGIVVALAPGTTVISAVSNGVTGNETIVVRQGPPTAQIDGNWTMTLSFSPDCTTWLPSYARTRTYTVHFTQNRMNILASMDGPTAWTNLPEQNTGTVQGADVMFVVWAASDDDGENTLGALYDQISPGELINVFGEFRGTVSGSEIRGVMAGGVNYWPPNTPFESHPTFSCFAPDHAVTLRR
jgi:hypothetical protein